jgi:RHS repeat-associated protein
MNTYLPVEIENMLMLAYGDPNYANLQPFLKGIISPSIVNILDAVRHVDLENKIYLYNPSSYLIGIYKSSFGACVSGSASSLAYKLLSQNSFLELPLLQGNEPIASFTDNINSTFGLSTYSSIMNQVYGTPGRYTGKYTLQEWDMYGSKRLGVVDANLTLQDITYNAFTINGSFTVAASYPRTSLGAPAYYFTHTMGMKRYELANHLGNVLEVISDKKLCSAGGGYEADVVSAQDYYPFGSPMPERSYTLISMDKYRFGFNGQEKENEIAGIGNSYSAEFWEYYSQLGRRWNIDQIVKPGISGYATFNNNPILFIDPNGKNASPVYNKKGEFLGTDDKGISGDAIVMNNENFKQGMNHEAAEKLNLGVVSLDGPDAKKKFANHYYELPNRPDYDGFVTIKEGITWAKAHPNLDNDSRESNGMGNATPSDVLYLDASKLNFGLVKPEDLILNEETNVNLLYNTNFSSDASIATTYALGRTILKLIDSKGTVQVINGNHNIYNWDYGGNLLRKTLIGLERLRTGINDTHGFPLFIFGTGKLTPPKQSYPTIRFNAY